MKTLQENDKKYLLDSIRCVYDFPKPGIVFRDITTLLNNSSAYKFLMDHLVDRYQDIDIQYIAGIESRGFIFASALAALLGKAFVPIRKPKKLPFITISQKYSLEYGIDELQIHTDAFRKEENARVLLIDDLIATGGTAKASVSLIKEAGAICVEACFLINIKDLKGAEDLIKFCPVYSILEV